MKEIEDDANRVKTYDVLRLSIFLKMTRLPRQSTDSMQSYQIMKIPFHRTRTESFAICMEAQKTPNSQNNLNKEKWS